MRLEENARNKKLEKVDTYEDKFTEGMYAHVLSLILVHIHCWDNLSQMESSQRASVHLLSTLVSSKNH